MLQKCNYNVQEYWPFAASWKSSPNLKHCKEIYFRGKHYVLFMSCDKKCFHVFVFFIFMYF